MTERWWYDLTKGEPVRDDERGPADHLLGPYPSRDAAERWREAHEGREAGWKQQDEAWEGDPAEDDA